MHARPVQRRGSFDIDRYLAARGDSAHHELGRLGREREVPRRRVARRRGELGRLARTPCAGQGRAPRPQLRRAHGAAAGDVRERHRRVRASREHRSRRRRSRARTSATHSLDGITPFFQIPRIVVPAGMTDVVYEPRYALNPDEDQTTSRPAAGHAAERSCRTRCRSPITFFCRPGRRADADQDRARPTSRRRTTGRAAGLRADCCEACHNDIITVTWPSLCRTPRWPAAIRSPGEKSAGSGDGRAPGGRIGWWWGSSGRGCSGRPPGCPGEGTSGGLRTYATGSPALRVPGALEPHHGPARYRPAPLQRAVIAGIACQTVGAAARCVQHRPPTTSMTWRSQVQEGQRTRFQRGRQDALAQTNVGRTRGLGAVLRIRHAIASTMRGS